MPTLRLLQLKHKKEKGDATAEAKAETVASFSIEMSADEYFEYRTNKEASVAQQQDQ